MSDENQRQLKAKPKVAQVGGGGPTGQGLQVPDVHEVMRRVAIAQGKKLLSKEEAEQEMEEEDEQEEETEEEEAQDEDTAQAQGTASAQKRKRKRMICFCGSPGCGIGPFTITREEEY